MNIDLDPYLSAWLAPALDPEHKHLLELVPVDIVIRAFVDSKFLFRGHFENDIVVGVARRADENEFFAVQGTLEGPSRFKSRKISNPLALSDTLYAALCARCSSFEEVFLFHRMYGTQEYRPEVPMDVPPSLPPYSSIIPEKFWVENARTVICHFPIDRLSTETAASLLENHPKLDHSQVKFMNLVFCSRSGGDWTYEVGSAHADNWILAVQTKSFLEKNTIKQLGIDLSDLDKLHEECSASETFNQIYLASSITVRTEERVQKVQTFSLVDFAELLTRARYLTFDESPLIVNGLVEHAADSLLRLRHGSELITSPAKVMLIVCIDILERLSTDFQKEHTFNPPAKLALEEILATQKDIKLP